MSASGVISMAVSRGFGVAGRGRLAVSVSSDGAGWDVARGRLVISVSEGTRSVVLADLSGDVSSMRRDFAGFREFSSSGVCGRLADMVARMGGFMLGSCPVENGTLVQVVQSVPQVDYPQIIIVARTRYSTVLVPYVQSTLNR